MKLTWIKSFPLSINHPVMCYQSGQTSFSVDQLNILLGVIKRDFSSHISRWVSAKLHEPIHFQNLWEFGGKHALTNPIQISSAAAAAAAVCNGFDEVKSTVLACTLLRKGQSVSLPDTVYGFHVARFPVVLKRLSQRQINALYKVQTFTWTQLFL